jgi:hypothetical protein
MAGEKMTTPATYPDLSIVIVPYRVREMLRDCLDSLYHGGLKGMNIAKTEVIVVDNDSRDGTPEMVREHFPQVKMIAGKENIGFSRANNVGIAQSSGRIVLLLNADTLIPEGAMKRCVDHLDAQPADVAAMTCRVQSPDGSLQLTCSRRLVTPRSEISRALLLDRVFPKSDFFNPEPEISWDRKNERSVECLLGAFMMIRREALEKIGLLDERFFLMYEDIDWCKRAADAGYRLMFLPDVFITHIGGASWRQTPIETYADSHIAAMQYFHKHFPRSAGLVHLTHRGGMWLKICALRLNLARKPGDEYSLKHLAMAQNAAKALRRLPLEGRNIPLKANHP